MCNYKRHAIIGAIVYSLFLIGLGIGLGINYLHRLEIDNNERHLFNITNFTITGYGTYEGNCQICSPPEDFQCWNVQGFYGYPTITYEAWYNYTFKRYNNIIVTDWLCDSTENAVLDYIKSKYPLNSTFVAYYNITNPIEWRKHLPGYQSYDGNFFNMMVVMLLIVIVMIAHGTFYGIWYCRNRNELFDKIKSERIIYQEI